MAPATVARMATTALTVFPFLKETAPLNEAGEVAEEAALEVPEEPLSEVAVLAPVVAPVVAPDEAPVVEPLAPLDVTVNVVLIEAEAEVGACAMLKSPL